MRILIGLVLVCSALLARPSPAAGQQAEIEARLEQVGRRGRLVYDFDLAARLASADLGRYSNLRNLRGWLIEPEGAGYRLIFYGERRGALVAVYRARIEGGRLVSSEAPADPPALTPVQGRMAAASAAMEGFTYVRCTTARLNLAIIPPESETAPVELYALAAETEVGVYPFGVHYLITVSPEGRRVSQRPFSRGCQNARPQNGPDGRPLALMIRHDLDPLPTEIHVFMSLWIRRPIYVRTADDRVWAVEGERIRILENAPN